MKKIFTLILFLPCVSILAQINGISGGKLSVPDASTLPIGTFEFEPSFSVSHSSNVFNNNSETDHLDGHLVTSSLLFRITTGLSDYLEAGAVLSSTMEQIDLGLKYKLDTGDGLKLCVAGGGTLPAGNKFIEESNKLDAGNYAAAIGALLSSEFDENLTFDAMLAYKKLFGDYFYHTQISLGTGLGYNFSQSFQGVLELNTFACYENGIYSGKIAGAAGFTYNVTENLLFVSGVQSDIWGKNDYKNFSYFGAFTISLN